MSSPWWAQLTAHQPVINTLTSHSGLGPNWEFTVGLTRLPLWLFADVSGSKNTPACPWALAASHRLPEGSTDEETVLWVTSSFLVTHRE